MAWRSSTTSYSIWDWGAGQRPTAWTSDTTYYHAPWQHWVDNGLGLPRIWHTVPSPYVEISPFNANSLPNIDAMSELSQLQSAYQELHVRFLSLLDSSDQRVPAMLDHIRGLLDRAAARIGMLTSEEAQWRQTQRLKRAEDERRAREQLRLAEVERLRRQQEQAEFIRRRYEEQMAAYRVEREARREAQRAYYVARNKSMRERVKAGMPYYEKMFWANRERRPFIDAMLGDNPDAKLIYCDWLEEQGDDLAALFLRQDDALVMPCYDERVNLPARARGFLRANSTSRRLGQLCQITPNNLYNSIGNFGWLAVMDTQEALEFVGLSLRLSMPHMIENVIPTYLRPALDRLFQKEE